MTARSVITGKAIPGASGVTLLARIRGAVGLLITQASLASIAWTVTDATLGTVLGTGTSPVASSVYDSLQISDPRWTQDTPLLPGPDGASGFNFQATLAASLFPVRIPAAPDLLAGPTPGAGRQCDVVFTPVSGQPWRVVFRWLEVVVFG